MGVVIRRGRALAALVVVERRQRDEGKALTLLRCSASAFSAGILIQLVFSAAMAGFFFVS